MTKDSKNLGRANKTSSKIALQILENWLKEFELAYNLSPELSKSQINRLKSEFNKIFEVDYTL
ncbi:MAG: hypothetical protein AAGF07_02265 [Patescibacteria group bacterium]